MKRLTICLILMCVCLAGCSSSTVRVQRAVPEELAYGAETLDIRNCDSNDDLITSLAAKAPAKQEISISEQATIIETGTPILIPTEIRDELRSRVESEYRPVYEEAVTSVEGVKFTIPGHMIHMYKIHWIQQIYRSTISFSVNEQNCETSYVYTLSIPNLDSRTVMACTA